ncbi:uncharacterized protein F5Z01DRAFT_630545 [Emericellopsis atlantica]|uniref:RING-type domain-containing protein n=1 Tax=Emericellopsis atlantica TaxID=2614577 RepID=A0A9P7ZE07_9HYPO|nr:uncharacterized protein F5Z01DRAFT_630545 [Emericellopsis atlantica]KAG9249996.1 hypothetical protein F5Z01DRAFT_630545 [Emericellopsis atlantica]
MASSQPDAAGPATDLADDAPSHRPDSIYSDSVASSASGRSPGRQSCPWRTQDFHDQECSRYFDCPSHTLERSRSSPTDRHADRPPNLDLEDLGMASRPGEATQNEQTTPAIAPRDRPLPPQPTEDEAQSDDEGSARPDERMASFARRPSQASASRLPPSPGTPGRYEFRPGAERPLIPLGHGPLPALPHNRSRPHTGGRRSSEYIAPRWQPDAEVTYCPICQTQFSFFVRKHHCRVVCNACSPHRIIIPHQFIVRPPGYELPPESLLMDQLGIGYVDVHGSGGERVRLCNPCVPDPNVAPPQNASGPLSPTSPGSARVPHQRSRSSIGDAYGAATASHRYGVVFASGQQNDVFQSSAPRHRSVTMVPHAMPHQSSRARPGPSTYYPGVHARYSTSASSSSAPFYPARYSSISQGPASPRHRNLPPTPQIAEEDECPICHRELPRRTLPDFATLREEHINACIQSHSTYGSPLPRAEGDTREQPAVAPRRTGMYTYPATEKDCIDDAECTICLEEFAVGVPMARLECLCRFHRSCITAWFVNHPGRCPVHQHDGFGY